MSEYVGAFLLGNAAIAGNVCLLPLYPGLFVLLANQSADGSARGSVRWMGAVVLAGLLTLMIALGFVLHLVHRSVADVLDWLLPALYLGVFALGVAMIAGRNPFARFVATEAPVARRPALTAYAYGMFLAPMTLPCTGPLIVSAFVIGGVAGTGALADSIAYFVFFSLGFGWPLVVIPLLAVPWQRNITRWLATRHRAIGVSSGVLLVAIAAFGYGTSVRAGSA